MDKTDSKILTILDEQGRISMKQLGDAVHLSAPAVATRVKNLEGAGVITRFAAIINLEAVGYTTIAHMIVLLNDVHRKDEFVEQLQTEPAVIEAYETMGRTDALLKVACHSIEELQALTYRLQNYGHVETYVHMKRYKDVARQWYPQRQGYSLA